MAQNFGDERRMGAPLHPINGEMSENAVSAFSMVAGGGFEPPLAANKTALVPVHYPALWCRLPELHRPHFYQHTAGADAPTEERRITEKNPREQWSAGRAHAPSPLISPDVSRGGV